MRNNKPLVYLASIATIGFSLSALAQPVAQPSYYDCAGIYIGAQGGYARTNYNLSSFIDEHVNKDGAVGRAYVGYQFNNLIGLETGFALYTNVDVPQDFGDIKTAHWDLLAKVGMPIGDSGFRVDVKGGGAYIMAKFDANDIANSVGLNDDKKKEFKPLAGASLSYKFNRNFAVDASYLHVFGGPKGDSLGTPNVDIATLGLSFLFVI